METSEGIPTSAVGKEGRISTRRDFLRMFFPKRTLKLRPEKNKKPKKPTPPDEGPNIGISRRDFLKRAALAAGATAALAKIPPPVEASRNQKVITIARYLEEKWKNAPRNLRRAWENALKAKDVWRLTELNLIRNLFCDENRPILPIHPEQLAIPWPPSDWSHQLEEEEKHWLPSVNKALKPYGIELKKGPKYLLDRTVKRWRKILNDPSLTVLDPDVERVNKLIRSFSQITGLPEDMIKTYGWIEDGLRGMKREYHLNKDIQDKTGDGQDGMFNPCVHEGAWGKRITLPSQEYSRLYKQSSIEVAYFRSDYIPQGITLPVLSNAIIYDTELNISFALAIAIDHLAALATETKFQPFREDIEKRGGKLQDLVGVAYAFYHHGVAAIYEKSKYIKDISQREGKAYLGSWERYYHRIADLATRKFLEREWTSPNHQITANMNTILQHKSYVVGIWTNFHTKNRTFYCPFWEKTKADIS